MYKCDPYRNKCKNVTPYRNTCINVTPYRNMCINVTPYRNKCINVTPYSKNLYYYKNTKNKIYQGVYNNAYK